MKEKKDRKRRSPPTDLLRHFFSADRFKARQWKQLLKQQYRRLGNYLVIQNLRQV